MLEQRDLDVLRELMRTEIDGRLGKTENLIRAEIDSRVGKTEDLLLDEIGRTQTYLEKQINDVKKNIENLEQYYRITKLENDNTAILLKIIEDIKERVEKLEQKTA